MTAAEMREAAAMRADNWTGDWDGEQLGDAIRAIPLPAEPAMAVKVKPLVWNEIKAPVAVACVGVYLMSHDFDGWYWILTQQGRVVNMETKPDLELTTAKAAAQADHDARIRAALEE